MKQPLNFTAELVPVAYAQALLDLAEELGVPRARLFDLARVRPEVLQSPNGRLSFIDFNLLAGAALANCGEPAFGLLLGQRLNVSTHGILGYAVLSSANLERAIGFALKYYRVLGLAYDLEMIEDGGVSSLRASESIPLGPMGRFAAEGLMTSLYTIARFLVGEPLQGVSVGFGHPAPPYAERYTEVFGCTVLFDQPYHFIALPSEYLARPMALANPATVQMCEQQCEALLATLDVQEGLLTRIRRLLLARPGEFPDLETVAGELHTSGRSLRRHLSKLGTTYQEVLDDVRKRLALQYLTTTHLPLYEIALLLGFNDPSNFRRAFRKWTGKLPTDYRQDT
ncbi:AraC family transcriptional regulator [Pseudomonas sp. ZM23]|uniref:AraC family transcriptional regulator n=1 Tax=Pseudomonas triclosanedens TaxID=2961893 RepID=A0ABY6ZW70_9PSED|nr:AraC family transcriptional regulator [Pseudomonas triclosanedens]MCP8463205.1 AraC family transcriptional regulator [Pseudomonas triclosanedens]MCP8469736.1 AraC family transcriptional regulator [Pseudomonas triclosanedens]MCP8474006.1 AraC family transcriptional regulator [Pseudomonas triclosanedens]WAI48596.1 AraC family transcriptional regulator [Pseudomonas triclosanedens]